MITEIAERGFAILPELLDETDLTPIDALFSALPQARPGIRAGTKAFSNFVAIVRVRRHVAQLIGADAKPVRALLFDKHDGTNWALGWHQDRTIEVCDRRDIAGFGPWTEKHGRIHVGPPIGILENMITVRIHLDPVDEANAPLRVSPASHRLGFIPVSDVHRVVATNGEALCLAQRGSVWFYATLVLHASARADAGRRRRVLQIDFSAEQLPGGLEWAAAA